MKTPTWQYFSLDEYQHRLDALRGRMQQKGVDVMLIHTPENLYYMTGYQTPGYYWYQTLVVPLDKEPVFITRILEANSAVYFSWVEDSRPYGDSDDWIAATRDVLVDLGMTSKRIGIEKRSWFITIDDFERLSSMMTSATFVDCSGLVEEGRMIKSPAELEYIKQAAEAAKAGMRAGIDACKVGASENDVAAAVYDAQIKAGSEYCGLPQFITSGPRSAVAHTTWYRQEIERDGMVFLELSGCVNRYHAALMRNVYMGDPPENMLKGTEVMATALQKTMDFIKPGVTAHDAHQFMARTIDDSDLGVTLEHRSAYSIGVAFAPDWGEGYIISLQEGEHRPLQAGMTFHIVPAVFLPGLATVGVSETIHVTENGCESLTDGLERKLFVK